jgi:hypothetical protein
MEKIIKFLKVEMPVVFDEYGDGYRDGNVYGNGNGNGYGNGNGNGDGNGNGYGNGNGDGYGYGNGYGNENGNGYGNENGNGYGGGYGLKSFNGLNVYLIDNMQTIITSVKNNIAKGFILQSDLSLTECFIVKGNNLFSHGSSIKKALTSLEAKILKDLPISKRIEMFRNIFKDVNKKYLAIDYYNWHFNLTGSCDMGRKSFAKDKNIDLAKDSFTVSEFIELTINNYGSNIIKELKDSYN